jgi:hypothetical protein
VLNNIQEVVVPLGSKRKIIYLLLFVSFWFCPRFVFADDNRGDGAESNEKPHEVRWEVDVGGQVRLRGVVFHVVDAKSLRPYVQS